MEAVQKLNNEKVLLEQSMEMEEEGIVNRLQRVIETVLARNKAVEACLEAHGLSVKDLNPPQVDVSTEWAYSRSPTRSDAQARLNSGAQQLMATVPYSGFELPSHAAGITPAGQALFVALASVGAFLAEDTLL